jgi:Spy/CpxP family protein refolding chaperone
MENSIENQGNRERGRGRKSFWIITGAALLIGVVSLTWSPQHRQFSALGERSAALEWNVERVLDAIDATEEQRVGLQPVLERARTEVQQITLAEHELRVVIMAALEANEFDPEEVSKLRTRAIRLSESAIDAVVESTVEIWSALTLEQRADVLRHWKRRS